MKAGVVVLWLAFSFSAVAGPLPWAYRLRLSELEGRGITAILLVLQYQTFVVPK